MAMVSYVTKESKKSFRHCSMAALSTPSSAILEAPVLLGVALLALGTLAAHDPSRFPLERCVCIFLAVCVGKDYSSFRRLHGWLWALGRFETGIGHTRSPPYGSKSLKRILMPMLDPSQHKAKGGQSVQAQTLSPLPATQRNLLRFNPLPAYTVIFHFPSPTAFCDNPAFID